MTCRLVPHHHPTTRACRTGGHWDVADRGGHHARAPRHRGRKPQTQWCV